MKILGKVVTGFALVVVLSTAYEASLTPEQKAARDAERAAEVVNAEARKKQERIDALRESLDYDRRIYARLCSGWGKNFAIHEMGGVQKYKDDSLSFLAGARTAREKNELLTDAECDAAFEKGTREGVAAVRNGDVKMRLW